MKYLYVFILLVFYSCSQKNKNPINQNLIYFKSSFLAEFGDEEYDKLEVKLNSKVKANYLDDLIIATKYVEANACGNYGGNIEIRKDSIFLIYKLLSDEVCTSTSIQKVTFIINNPAEKKYEFKIKYE